MASYDFSGTRLFIPANLTPQASITLEPEQHNYIRNVMRLTEGAMVMLFNGRDGEWRARLTQADKRRTVFTVEELTRSQTTAPDVWYLFAPLKHARLDYMIQKAVEMGAGKLWPVLTQRTQAHRINLDRMQANVVEAAEQCGIIAVPEVLEPQKLTAVLDNWPAGRTVVFCDEDAPLADSIQALEACRGKPMAVLIGPEGGFDPAERARLLAMPETLRLSLGPRILRADTAAVAALSIVQALAGDWQGDA